MDVTFLWCSKGTQTIRNAITMDILWRTKYHKNIVCQLFSFVVAPFSLVSRSSCMPWLVMDIAFWQDKWYSMSLKFYILFFFFFLFTCPVLLNSFNSCNSLNEDEIWFYATMSRFSICWMSTKLFGIRESSNFTSSFQQ